MKEKTKNILLWVSALSGTCLGLGASVGVIYTRSKTAEPMLNSHYNAGKERVEKEWTSGKKVNFVCELGHGDKWGAWKVSTTFAYDSGAMSVSREYGFLVDWSSGSDVVRTWGY